MLYCYPKVAAKSGSLNRPQDFRLMSTPTNPYMRHLLLSKNISRMVIYALQFSMQELEFGKNSSMLLPKTLGRL